MICRVLGHRWEFRSQACQRCGVTAAELHRRGQLPRDPIIAYELGYGDAMAERERIRYWDSKRHESRRRRRAFETGWRYAFRQMKRSLNV